MLNDDGFMVMKRTMIEKREYTAPDFELVEIGVLNVLALSKDEAQIDSDDQMSQENRGDWEDIWVGM